MTPKPGKRKRRPTIAETREEMACSGDVSGLLHVLTTSTPGLFGVEETFRLFARAIQVRSRQDPAGFAAELFGRMVGLVGYLVMRAHIHAERLVAVHDRRDRAFAEVPRELTDVLLPQLIQLQEHLAELMSAQAAVARLWALTRHKELESNRAAHPEVRPGNGAPRRDDPPAGTQPTGLFRPEGSPEMSRKGPHSTEDRSDGGADKYQG
jgi:hypothetical protein